MGEGGWGGPMSDDEVRGLYIEFQCIMGNGYIGTVKQDSITSPQLCFSGGKNFNESHTSRHDIPN